MISLLFWKGEKTDFKERERESPLSLFSIVRAIAETRLHCHRSLPSLFVKEKNGDISFFVCKQNQSRLLLYNNNIRNAGTVVIWLFYFISFFAGFHSFLLLWSVGIVPAGATLSLSSTRHGVKDSRAIRDPPPTRHATCYIHQANNNNLYRAWNLKEKERHTASLS